MSNSFWMRFEERKFMEESKEKEGKVKEGMARVWKKGGKEVRRRGNGRRIGRNDDRGIEEEKG